LVRKVLKDVLVPLGGIGLMLYGPFGRAGIYPIQEIMRRLREDTQIEKLPLPRRVLDVLPSTNLLWHHERFREGMRAVNYDAELIDLFLHPVDRPFTVPELGALCVGAGLRIVRFLPTAKYEPSLIWEMKRYKAVPQERIDRAALAGLLAGNIHMHTFFAVREDNPDETEIDISIPDLPGFVPIVRDTTDAALAAELGENETFSYGFYGTNIVATITPVM
jgi:hypothetical protein